MVTSNCSKRKAVVTVVTYNSAADIKRCVMSLAEHFDLLNAGQAEVQVVDNNSCDETPVILQQLAEKYAWLHLHLMNENLGFGCGNNVVLNRVSASAHILINADTWLIGDSLTPALERLKNAPETGIIGLPLVYPDGSPQTYSFLPAAWHRWLLTVMGLRKLANVLVQYKLSRYLMKFFPFTRNFARNHGRPKVDLNSASELIALATCDPRPVAWVAGAAMVLSQNFVTTSKGFDPNIFLYGEDEDLCIQAYKLGFRVETLATIPIIHKLGWGGEAGFNPAVAHLKYESLRYFIKKNITGIFQRTLMRLLLPIYVYGWKILHFFR